MIVHLLTPWRKPYKCNQEGKLLIKNSTRLPPLLFSREYLRRNRMNEKTRERVPEVISPFSIRSSQEKALDSACPPGTCARGCDGERGPL